MKTFSCFNRQFSLRQVRKNFTLLELLTVMAIIAILSAILLPALNQARIRGQAACCLGNVRTISTGLANYLDAYEGFLPRGHCGRVNGTYWHVMFAARKLIDTEIPGCNRNDGMAQGVYSCPAMDYNKLGKFKEAALWNTYKGCSYGLNRYLSLACTEEEKARIVRRKINQSRTPSRTYAAGDKWLADRDGSAPPQVYIRARYYQPGERHAGRWNAVMLDGHAAAVYDYPCRGQKADYNAPEWRVY